MYCSAFNFNDKKLYDTPKTPFIDQYSFNGSNDIGKGDITAYITIFQIMYI